MTNFPAKIAERRGANALRVLAVAALATSLAGCFTQRVAQQEPYPTDYRERHPITLKEGERTVEVFVGRNRGGLSPSQRADVLGFAQQWRHEATSGIIVDVPRGRATDRATADSMHEVQSILAAAGVPRNAIYARPYKASSFTLASIKLNYAQTRRDRRPLRSLAPRSRHQPGSGLHREPALLESRLRQPAQSCRHGRQPRRSGAAARRSAGLCPRAARWRSTTTARAKIHPAPIPATTINPKSAISANDKTRITSRRV